MSMKSKKKTILIIISIVVSSLVLVVAIPFIVLGVRTSNIKNDYSYLKQDAEYSTKVEVDGVELVTQHVSCGYASIEMLSTFYGNRVSEDDLDAKNNGRVSTSSSRGFLKEVNASISSKSFVKHSYLKNDVFLKEIHESLSKNNPVAIEWAAKYENEWTLHFSVVTGLDLSNDKVTIYNPYGYIETIKVDEFIGRTTFEAYEKMPLFLSFGFAFGAFEKNTIFFAN